MFRVRAIAVLFLVAFLASISVVSQDAFAAAAPFTWTKYKAKDGKEYNHPIWNDAGGNRRTLASAQGVLTFAQTPAVTEVIFRIYRHGEQGGWNATPVIDYTVTPAAQYTPGVGWILNGIDNNAPAIRFDEGEEIRIIWYVTTTDENNNKTYTEVELIITVEYHAT